MFNRPEMIPSQRLIRQTPLERLEQMRATAPNAQEAEALLRCLVVFQSILHRQDIIVIAPEGMDDATRINAFMTLRYWSLVQKATPHTYRIPESIKRLYPPSHELMARHFATFIEMRAYGTNFIRDYWPDISAALLWALEHEPTKVLGLAQSIARYWHNLYLRQDWPAYLSLLLNEAYRLKDISLQAFVFDQRGDQAYRNEEFAEAEDWYKQALTLYTQLGNQRKQASLFALRGKIAHQMGQRSIARGYYEQSLKRPRLSNREFESLLRDIFWLEWQDENVDRTRLSLEQLLPVAPRWQHSHYFFHFAELLHKKSCYEDARTAFATALTLATRPDSSRIYLAWAKMEYALGNTQAGCNLCRLALIHSSYLSEHHFHNEKEHWEEFVAIRTMLADMGCDEG